MCSHKGGEPNGLGTRLFSANCLCLRTVDGRQARNMNPEQINQTALGNWPPLDDLNDDWQPLDELYGQVRDTTPAILIR